MHSNPPIYLFADSQCLFWKPSGTLFIETIRQGTRQPSPKAAYIGASNHDAPEFYSIFEAAMEGIGIRQCSFIRSSFCEQDRTALAEAEVILLAGGDIEVGWKVLESTGMKEIIRQKYAYGATLMGVSAGAMQLGKYGVVRRDDSSIALLETLNLVPFVIDAHDEAHDWDRLSSVVQLLEGTVRGIGMPSGGALLCYPDQAVEAVRNAATAFSVVDRTFKRELLLPVPPALLMSPRPL